MTALIKTKNIRQEPATKPVASLTAGLMKRDTRRSADILQIPCLFKPRPLMAKPLPRLTAILRTPETRLFISVSSAAFTFILGFIG